MAVHVEPWTWQQGVVITFKSMWKQTRSMKIPGLHDMVGDVRWYYRLWDTSYQPWPVLTLLLKMTCSFGYRIVGYFLGVLILITFMTSLTSPPNVPPVKFSTHNHAVQTEVITSLQRSILEGLGHSLFTRRRKYPNPPTHWHSHWAYWRPLYFILLSLYTLSREWDYIWQALLCRCVKLMTQQKIADIWPHRAGAVCDVNTWRLHSCIGHSRILYAQISDTEVPDSGH